MDLKVIYDREADVLRLFTGEGGATSTSLHQDLNVVLDLAAADVRQKRLEALGAIASRPARVRPDTCSCQFSG